MAFQATFGYNNIEAVSDLNLATKVLVKKGIVTGFDVSPVAGTVNVTVGTGYLVSDDGMIVRSTDVETLVCVGGQKNNIVFRAVYNSPQAPTLQLEVLTDAGLVSDPQRSFLVLLAAVDLTSATQTTAADIDYSMSDRVSIQGRDTFLGPYDTPTQLFSAYPSIAPVKQRDGDFALVKSDAQAKPTFYVWLAGSWITLGNYEDLLLQYNVHVSGVIGSGTSVHVTLAEKAAIGGTMGAPGPSNRFVTENDTTRLTTLEQKAAIDYAITGPEPLSAANPLVANGIPVALPRVIGISVGATPTDTIKIAYGDTGTAQAYFGVPVYVGKLGLDPTHENKSTARIWFDLQDSFTAGYVDEDGALYIKDILEGSGSGSWSPSTDGSVSSKGYWKPNAPEAAIIIKLSRELAAGKTVYVRFYASGTLSGLAPQDAYHPPATARSNAMESYREINTAIIVNLLSDTIEASKTVIADGGSVSAPGFQFRMPDGTLNGTGIYALGDVVTPGYAFHNSVAVASATDTIAVFAKSTSGNNSNIGPVQAPLVFEQHATATAIQYRMHIYSSIPSGDPVIEIGTSSPAGYVSALRVGQILPTFYGVQFDTSLSMGADTVVHADSGTADTPAITLGADHTSGVFSVASFTAGSLSYFNAVGLSTRGRAAFVFASSTAGADGLVQGAGAPLLFQQYVDAGKVGYTFAITRAGLSAAEPDGFAFGAASYAAPFALWAKISAEGLAVTGGITGQMLAVVDDVTTGGILTVGGSEIVFANNICTLHGSMSGVSLGFGSSTPIDYISSGRRLMLNALSTVLGGKVLVASGSEAAPSYSFTSDTRTGLFYAGTLSNVDAPDAVSTRKSVGVSIEGATVLLIGRNEVNPGTLAPAQAPLLIEQSIDGANVELRLAAVDRSGDNSILVLGTADYVTDFTPYVTVGNGRIALAKPVYLDDALHAQSLLATSVASTTYVRAATYVQASLAVSVASSPALRIGTASGVYGDSASGIVGISVGGVSVFESGELGGFHVTLPLDTKITGRLNVSDDAVFAGMVTTGVLNVTGSATLTSASLSGNLSVAGSATLSGNTSIGGTLAVAGSTTFGAAANVVFNSQARFNSTVLMVQAVDLQSTLSVAGNVTLYSNVSASGNVTLGSVTIQQTGSLIVNSGMVIASSGAFNCAATSNFTGAVTADSITVSDLTVDQMSLVTLTASGSVHADSALSVGSSSFFTVTGAGDVDIALTATKSLRVHDNLNSDIFKVTADGVASARVLSFLGMEDITQNGAAAVGRNTVIRIPQNNGSYLPPIAINLGRIFIYVFAGLGTLISAAGEPDIHFSNNAAYVTSGGGGMELQQHVVRRIFSDGPCLLIMYAFDDGNGGAWYAIS